jgi:cell division protein ZapA
MSKDTIRTTVQIMDSEYRISSPAGERDSLIEAAQYLNEKMLEIRDSGRVLGVERIAVMAALNLSYELLKCKQDNTETSGLLNGRLQNLLDKMETALNKTKQMDV